MSAPVGSRPVSPAGGTGSAGRICPYAGEAAMASTIASAPIPAAPNLVVSRLRIPCSLIVFDLTPGGTAPAWRHSGECRPVLSIWGSGARPALGTLTARAGCGNRATHRVVQLLRERARNGGLAPHFLPSGTPFVGRVGV